VYVILIYAINFQVSIDGGGQTQFQFDGVCDPAASSCSPTYGFVIYNIQSLQSGTHTLDLTLLNPTGTDGAAVTAFYFDYAAVNETDAFPTQATSSTAFASILSTVPASTPSSAAAYTPTTSTVAPPSPAPSATQ
jgi:hypothetical protein